MSETLATQVRGRHAASDNMIIVKDENGKQACIRNLSTRISPDTTEVQFSSACEGTVCLRVDDKHRSDFWMEFNLDIPTLERLLSKAKQSLNEREQ